MLAEGDDVGQRIAEMRLEVPDLGGVGARAGHEARTRRRTDGLLAIGAGEGEAGLRDPVEVGRFHVARAISAELGTQIVNRDEEDVGPISGVNQHWQQRQAEDSEEGFHEASDRQ